MHATAPFAATLSQQLAQSQQLTAGLQAELASSSSTLAQLKEQSEAQASNTTHLVEQLEARQGCEERLAVASLALEASEQRVLELSTGLARQAATAEAAAEELRRREAQVRQQQLELEGLGRELEAATQQGEDLRALVSVKMETMEGLRSEMAKHVSAVRAAARLAEGEGGKGVDTEG